MTEVSSWIIDVRDGAAYRRGHPRGAFHFPWPEMNRLACGLPDRNCSIEVVMDGAEGNTEAVKEYFYRLKYKEMRLRHIAEYVALTQDEPPGVCFSPNKYLCRQIEFVEGRVGKGGVALDVGCGSGRDMIYLARRGWFVLGIENRQRLLDCARALACRCGVDHRVAGLLWNIKKGEMPIRPHSYDLLHCCRFIHRASLPLLIQGLRVGGFVVYSHFLEGCEKTAVGHPKNSNGFFFRGELESIVESCGIRILCAEETCLFDGRPMIHVWGQKMAPEQLS